MRATGSLGNVYKIGSLSSIYQNGFGKPSNWRDIQIQIQFKNYEFSSRNILGNRRLIHVSIPDENSEDRKYFTYDMKTINKTTVNLRCHQRGKNGNKCPAILSCTVAFDIVEKILDAETKSRTKRWIRIPNKKNYSIYSRLN